MRFSKLQKILAAMALAAAACIAQAGEITVSAATSLTNALREIASEYEARNPGSKVALNFGASGALLQQIARGAPVDVFASADQETMDMAVAQGLVAAAGRRDFTANTLVLVVPADSRLALKKLADLRQPGVRRIALGNPASVPAGRYARQALQAAGLWSEIEAKAIHTSNVRQSLDYVARGEVDAGFVYATDAALMRHKLAVAFAVPLDSAIRYPIAPTTASARDAKGVAASRFVDFVMSPAGQAILGKYGFLKP